MPTTDEIMAKHMDPKAKKKPGAKSTLGQMAMAWKEHVGETTGTFVPALTAKQMGMLKHCAAKVEGHRDPVAMVRDLVVDWIGFVERVRKETGTSLTPTKPSLEYVLKHIDVAANFERGTGTPVAVTKAETGGLHMFGEDE